MGRRFLFGTDVKSKLSMSSSIDELTLYRTAVLNGSDQKYNVLTQKFDLPAIGPFRMQPRFMD